MLMALIYHSVNFLNCLLFYGEQLILKNIYFVVLQMPMSILHNMAFEVISFAYIKFWLKYEVLSMLLLGIFYSRYCGPRV